MTAIRFKSVDIFSPKQHKEKGNINKLRTLDDYD